MRPVLGEKNAVCARYGPGTDHDFPAADAGVWHRACFNASRAREIIRKEAVQEQLDREVLNGAPGFMLVANFRFFSSAL